MLSVMFILFSVLLLVPSVLATCQHCFGEAIGCRPGETTCPWVTGISDNATAVATIIAGVAGATTLKVATLLPTRFRRLFTRNVLDTITNIIARPRSGAEFDSDGKTLNQVIGAIKARAFTKHEAMLAWVGRMDDLNDEDDDYDTQFKKLNAQLSVIKDLPNDSPISQGNDNVYLFVLAKLSSVICKDKDLTVALDVCGDVDTTNGSSSSSSSSSSWSSAAATLTRPKSWEKMVALLNDWTLFLLALGTSPLVLLPFLADVVFTPLSNGALEWPVAFELLIIYLQEIEKNPDTWNLANVYAKSGAIDVRRAEAIVLARAHYAAGCFRARGGNPGLVTPGGGAIDLSNITKFTSTSKRGCVAWNNGVAHRQDHLDSSGRCRFLHACNHWVKDKGKNGQCLGKHKRDACDYPADQKCAEPVKA